MTDILKLLAQATVFDLETDNLLEGVTFVQCLNLIDRRTGERLRYTDHEFYGFGPETKDDGTPRDTSRDGMPVPRAGTLEDGMARLQLAPCLVAHNGIKYDAPVLEKLYGWKPEGVLFDTLTAAAVVWTNLKDVDFALLRSGKLPMEFQKGGLIGRQSLEAHGYRVGNFKGDFNPKDFGFTWENCPFLPEMDDYCEQDCEVALKLVEKIESKNYSPACLGLEMHVALILARQERRGFAVDVGAAERLCATLQGRRAELSAACATAFPPWVVSTPFTPKANNKSRGYVKGVPTLKHKTMVFNPSSRDHIADRLTAVYGWAPGEFTPEGKPKVDETTLESLPYPEAKLLAEHFMVEKRLAQVSDGKEGWLKHVRHGRIHGTVNTNGAVTGRMTHAKPNIAQVPKCGSPYGEECRSVFVASPGYVLVGCDAEGLELRMLAHYMARWDGGEYAKAVVEGRKEDETDVHNVNRKAAGLNVRDNSKTFIYALLYGAGPYKLGTIVYDDFTEKQKAAFDAKYATGKARASALTHLGKARKARLMAQLPAFAELTAAVQAAAKKFGKLKGLDGRWIHCRSPHSALNALLQGGGAIVMKKALCIIDDTLDGPRALEVHHVANIHDEFQMETRPDCADELGKLAADSIRLAGEHFNLKCPLSGSYAIGKNWAETH